VDKRPVNLNLMTIKLPITSIVSITHRVTGVVLLGGILVLLWMLDVSLESEKGFAFIGDLLDAVWAKIVLWMILAALAYHLVTGVRHLIMDMGFWETLQGGRTSAHVSIALSVILIILAGIWLW